MPTVFPASDGLFGPGGGGHGAGHQQQIRLPLLASAHAQEARLGLRLLEQRRDGDDRIGILAGELS